MTPMLRQYHEMKKRHPDAILFFRLGDFYEVFFDDAREAAAIMGVTLTARAKGKDRIPMAGVPYHAAAGYLKKLIAAGRKVAICDQVAEPGRGEKLMERGVVRVVTPGTLTEDALLESREHNFLLAINPEGERAGLAWADVSTGDFLVEDIDREALGEALRRIRPAEVLLPREEREAPWAKALAGYGPLTVTGRDGWRFAGDQAKERLTRQFKTASLDCFDVRENDPCLGAAGACLDYLEETQRAALGHLRALKRFQTGRHLIVDGASLRNLDLLRNSRTGSREGSLLQVLDRTLTAMGGRLLADWIAAPLREPGAIRARQEAIGELREWPGARELEERLGEVPDLERLAARIATGRAGPRDLAGLRRALEQLPGLGVGLRRLAAPLSRELAGAWDDLPELGARLKLALADNPPPALKDGGVIRDGFDQELDRLRGVGRDGDDWLAAFARRESERTGIPSLKVGFNQVFGYYIEVTNPHREKVPDSYVRKQTLKNAERYITPELKERETEVLHAADRRVRREEELFDDLRREAAGYTGRLQEAAARVAALDALNSLAVVAAAGRYVCPAIESGARLAVTQGRHPVLERLLPAGSFVPNDLLLDADGERTMLITGPNMAGKSTFIRQVALLVVMAQLGSFVPAQAMSLGPVDRIFTRVGSADDLSRGQSTFMVEMTETANIIHHATSRSLIILDEVGRGTSTFDGVSIAWAVTEWLHQRCRGRLLFATHYHELTALAQSLAGLANYSVAVREWQDEIVFLYQVVPGGTDRSYGLHVAQLAGIPGPVVERARQVLAQLEGANFARPAPAPAGPAAPRQVNLLEALPAALVEEIARLDLDRLTPLAAWERLKKLQEELDPGRGEAR